MASTLLYLVALAHMPIANITAILQAMPIILTLVSAVFLGEEVRWRRWAAVGVGFLGMLLVVRPGGADFDIFSLLAVASLAFLTLRDVATRAIPRAIPSLLVISVASIAVTASGGALALAGEWQPMSALDITYLMAAGAFLVGGYFFIVEAMRHGEMSVVAPFRYAIILLAILYGLVIWGEMPDPVASGGIVLIVASGLYVFYRESQLKRTGKPVTQTPPEAL